MITAESLRHFVAEWIKIDPPKRKISQYPWGKQDLYLLNLYTLSAPTYLTEMPVPFISILFDQATVEEGEYITDERRLYRGHFKDGSFMLPRRYLLDGSCNSDTAFHTNRYHYTSDGYDMMADWNKADLKLIRYMQNTPHIRRHMLNSPECDYLYRRLISMAQRHDIQYRFNPNMLDFTGLAQEQIKDGTYQAAPETMLIQAPIVGLLDKVRRRAVTTIINGALVNVGKESVEMALATEPCASEYIKERAPFKELKGHHVDVSAMASTQSMAIVYIIVEAPGGAFEFREYNPKTRMTIQGKNYFRVLTHNFTMYPELYRGTMETRLKHFINEGLIPDTPQNRSFATKRDSALFGIADMPKGYKMNGEEIIGPKIEG